MINDWTRNYDKMCKREQVLNLAIETARDDLVKPVTAFNTLFLDDVDNVTVVGFRDLFSGR